VVRVVVPVLPVRRDPRLLGQDALRADEDVLELVAGAAPEVGVVLVRVDRRARLGLHLAHAGMVVDERRVALGVARRAWRLRSLVGAGEPVFLVEQVLALVAGAGAQRLDLVAVRILRDGEAADRGRAVRMRGAISTAPEPARLRPLPPSIIRGLRNPRPPRGDPWTQPTSQRHHM